MTLQNLPKQFYKMIKKNKEVENVHFVGTDYFLISLLFSKMMISKTSTYVEADLIKVRLETCCRDHHSMKG